MPGTENTAVLKRDEITVCISENLTEAVTVHCDKALRYRGSLRSCGIRGWTFHS